MRYKPFFSAILILICAMPLCAAENEGGHRGAITSVIHSGNTVITAGEDGFIVIWDVFQKTAKERFQLTADRILSLVSNPLKDEICIAESAGINNYKISAWNYNKKEKLFSLHSNTPVTYINYSAGGSFVIAAGFNGSYLTLIDSATGQIVFSPDIPAGTAALAATGRAERNMLLYQSEHEDHSFHESSGFSYDGQILYLDLITGTVTGRFHAPSYMSNPVIFGNNRFIAGINSAGLLLVDAATGEILDSAANIARNALLFPFADGFYCLSGRSGILTLYRFTIGRDGKLVSQQQPLIFNADTEGSMPAINAFAYNGSAVFATANGTLLSLDQRGRIISFTGIFQQRITEIALGEGKIAFLTESGSLGFLPADYLQFKDKEDFFIEEKRGFTKITPLTSAEFILWQAENTRNPPQIVHANSLEHIPPALNFLLGRFPLRSISALDGNLLTLDAGGNLSVRNLENLSAEADFSFLSVGAADAALVDGSYLFLCRSAINNNSPFLYINFKTGETVPIFYGERGRSGYGVLAGLSVTAGNSAGSFGSIYAEAIEQGFQPLDGGGLKTIVIEFSPVTMSSTKIFEYPGEAPYLSIAQSADRLAVACASEGAFIAYDSAVYFERTNGLPVKLQGGNNCFISLDSEGNIAWHDNITGKILAVFSLYEDKWVLKNGGSPAAGRELTGKIRQYNSNGD